MNKIEISKAINALDSIDVSKLEQIGEGSLSKVYKIRIANQDLALKCVKNYEFFNQLMTYEDSIYKQVQESLFVANYYGRKYLQIIDERENYQAYAMFFQYYDTSLTQILRQNIPWKTFTHYFSDLIIQLTLFKSQGIIFKQLNPNKIFMDKKQDKFIFSGLREGDLLHKSCTKYFELLNDQKIITKNSIYVSPEICQLSNKSNTVEDYDLFASDLYSLGIILLEMLGDEQDIKMLNKAKILGDPENYNDTLNNMLSHLKEKLNTQNIDLDDKLFYLRLFLKMLQMNQSNRIDVFEILEKLLIEQKLYLENYDEKIQCSILSKLQNKYQNCLAKKSKQEKTVKIKGEFNGEPYLFLLENQEEQILVQMIEMSGEFQIFQFSLNPKDFLQYNSLQPFLFNSTNLLNFLTYQFKNEENTTQIKISKSQIILSFCFSFPQLQINGQKIPIQKKVKKLYRLVDDSFTSEQEQKIKKILSLNSILISKLYIFIYNNCLQRTAQFLIIREIN